METETADRHHSQTRHCRRSHRLSILVLTWLICFPALPLRPSLAGASSPYQLRFANPATQTWRISKYPELEERGLRSIAEDRQGNMWFGVNDGVVRYDGLSWKTYGAADGLTGGAVESMVVRDDGAIVAATQDGLFQLGKSQWQRIFPRARPAGLSITFVTESSDHVLWACCSWGLIQWTPGSAKLFTSREFRSLVQSKGIFNSIESLPQDCLPRTRYPTGTGIFLVDRTVVSLSSDSPAMAAGLRRGDTILDVQGEASNLDKLIHQEIDQHVRIRVERPDTRRRETISFTTTPITDRRPSPAMHSVMQDSQGRIWVGASHGKVFVTDDSGLSWNTWEEDEGLKPGQRPSAMETADGEIWVISSEYHGGVCRFDGATWTAEKLWMLTGSNYVSAAAQTVDGTIWISGLNRLHLWRRGRWRTHDTRDIGVPGDSHRMLVASDDSLWIAGFGQYPVRIGMSRDEFVSVENLMYQCALPRGTQWFIEPDTGRVIRYDGKQAVAYGVEDDLISKPTGIAAVPGVGVVAFGGHNDVAAVSTFDGRTWNRVEFPEVSREFSDKAFAVTREGHVWIGARGRRHEHQVGGLVSGIGDTWQHHRPPDAPGYSTSIAQLPDGRMLVGAIHGVFVFDRGEWLTLTDDLLFETPSPDGTIDSSGTAWLATRNRGVLRYRQGQWTTLTTKDGLLSNEVATIAAGEKDDIWVSTSEGLCRFDGSQFHRVDLPGQFGRKSIKHEPGRGIWFDGTHRYTLDVVPPTATLDESSIEVEPHSNVVLGWHGVDAWNRTAADRLHWSYRIDGGPWSPFENKTQLVLSNLSPGEHAIQVRSRDDDLNLSTVSRATLISVLPPVWMRPWFLATAAGLLAILCWQSASLIRRGMALRSSHQQLEQARALLAEQFAEKSAQFRAVCDCSPVGIFVSDTAGKITYFNDHLERIAGMPSQTAQGYGWLGAIHPADRERVLSQWEDALARNVRYQNSGRFLLRDGTTTWFNVVADRIERDGELLGYVGAVEDATERVVASEDLKKSNEKLLLTLEQLKQAQAQTIKQARLGALGQMAAGVAHDINNSLAPLLTYSELLAGENSVGGKNREWIELIRLGVRDTAGIVKRLEHFYRKSHDRESLESIPLADIVSQAVELTRPKWHDAAQADGKSIDVRMETQSSPVVDGDPSQMRAVVTNLIFNAVDAIEEHGTVFVRVGAKSGQAVVEVVDDGSGMTSEQLDHCMEPFFTSKPMGSGLGLSECHGVVRQHGGRIEIESHEGAGTQVRVLLPTATDRSNSRARPPRDESSNKPSSPPAAAGGAPATTSTVLCIDDDPAVRRSTAALLTALGVSVETAHNGPAGLQLLEQRSIQLVMCDQGMPGMDGMTFLKEVKTHWPDLPVVIVSGWSLPDSPGDPRPDGFLKKPVALDDLLSLLRRFLPSACAG